jgi:hypothetical protein
MVRCAPLKTVSWSPRLLQVASNYYVDTRISDTWVPRYKVVIDAFNNFRTDIALLKFLVDTHCAF